MKDLGQQGDLLERCQGLDTWYDRDINSLFATSGYKIKIGLVIKKHLGGNELSPRLDLLFEPADIRLEVGSIVVLFGITSHPNAKIGGSSVDQFIVHVTTLVHSIHLLQQFQGVLVPIRLRHKGCFVFEVIAPQNQDIIDSQKCKSIKAFSVSSLLNPRK